MRACLRSYVHAYVRAYLAEASRGVHSRRARVARGAQALSDPLRRGRGVCCRLPIVCLVDTQRHPPHRGQRPPISGWLPRPTYVLLTWACEQFYQSGSSLTKWRANAKVRVERVRCVHMRLRVRAHELQAKRACSLPAHLPGKFRRVVPRRCRWPQCFPSPGGRPLCVCVLCLNGCAHVLCG